jgi:CubicO group peptidase (beta-lactamase class C family)
MKTIQSLLFSILVLASTIHLSRAQKLEEKLDALMSAEYPEDEPGITVLVAKEGEVLFRKAYGMANLELDVPMKPEMVFEIASITKQFTAVAILMLVEEGKLSLEDDIRKFIPDYPTHGHTITVHHLLTHTSGIKDYGSIQGIWDKARLDHTSEEILDYFKNEPMDFDPGEKYLYNNSAYFLLGMIIEKVSGLPYPEFLENKIFSPLGMENSYYGSQKRIIPNRAYGYQKGKEGWVNAEYVSMTNPGAAGSIMSCVDDLLTWNQALLENKLISAGSMRKAISNYTLNDGKSINYGYGWALSKVQGSPTYEHGGGIFGYLTKALYLAEEKVYVTTLSNRDDKSPDKINAQIAAITIGKPYPAAEKIMLPEETLLQFTGVYEFEDEAVRYIIIEDGQLYSQRKGGSRSKIFPLNEQKFSYENSLSTIEFKKLDNKGMKAVFEDRMGATNGMRTSMKVPDKKQ